MVVVLYNKVCDIISNISELLEIQLLTDTTILQVQFSLYRGSNCQRCVTLLTLILCLSISAPMILGFKPWHHTLFCGECQRTAVMRHHISDSSKSALGQYATLKLF